MWYHVCGCHSKVHLGLGIRIGVGVVYFFIHKNAQKLTFTKMSIDAYTLDIRHIVHTHTQLGLGLALGLINRKATQKLESTYTYVLILIKIG